MALFNGTCRENKGIERIMKKQAEISTYGLKMIAVICMLIDHITAAGLIGFNPTVYMIGRGIGRIAFPIFCFLIVEGYYYSRNRLKYLSRLLLLAFLSEIPFDLVFTLEAFSMSYQNVFFTLSIGLAAIIILGEIDRFCTEKVVKGRSELQKRFYKFLNIIGQLSVMALMTTVAELLRTDYSANGVLLIMMIYFFEKFYAIFHDSVAKYGVQKVKNMLAAFSVFLWFFFYDLNGGGVNESFGFPVIMLLYFYSGKRGNYSLPGWVFYAFYPLHLFIIAIIRIFRYGL